MDTTTITVSLDRALVGALDRLVRAGLFESRSSAIQQALRETLGRVEAARGEQEADRALALEGMGVDGGPGDWQDIEG